ncbi:MAG: hypothetical protein B7Z40_20420 [Bosea sp. 12-68-7]|nr:MAG: hypothetical protein B7Z40_20420 [Bosea sp. 12-68-7]
MKPADAATGAFLSGAVLDSDLFDQEQMDQFRHNILLAVMPVFFLSTGLRTDWEVGGVMVFAAAATEILPQIKHDASPFATLVGPLIGSANFRSHAESVTLFIDRSSARMRPTRIRAFSEE